MYSVHGHETGVVASILVNVDLAGALFFRNIYHTQRREDREEKREGIQNNPYCITE